MSDERPVGRRLPASQELSPLLAIRVASSLTYSGLGPDLHWLVNSIGGVNLTCLFFDIELDCFDKSTQLLGNSSQGSGVMEL